MSESGLHVHTENLNRAFQLYESVGFHIDKMFTIYHKLVQQPPQGAVHHHDKE